MDRYKFSSYNIPWHSNILQFLCSILYPSQDNVDDNTFDFFVLVLFVFLLFNSLKKDGAYTTVDEDDEAESDGKGELILPLIPLEEFLVLAE